MTGRSGGNISGIIRGGREFFEQWSPRSLPHEHPPRHIACMFGYFVDDSIQFGTAAADRLYDHRQADLHGSALQLCRIPYQWIGKHREAGRCQHPLLTKFIAAILS